MDLFRLEGYIKTGFDENVQDALTVFEKFSQIGQGQQLEAHFSLGDTQETIQGRQSQFKAGGIGWVIKAFRQFGDCLNRINFIREIEVLAEANIQAVTKGIKDIDEYVILREGRVAQICNAGFKDIGLRIIRALIDA